MVDIKWVNITPLVCFHETFTIEDLDEAIGLFTVKRSLEQPRITYINEVRVQKYVRGFLVGQQAG
jgi:hypothetical protein